MGIRNKKNPIGVPFVWYYLAITLSTNKSRNPSSKSRDFLGDAGSSYDFLTLTLRNIDGSQLLSQIPNLCFEPSSINCSFFLSLRIIRYFIYLHSSTVSDNQVLLRCQSRKTVKRWLESKCLNPYG